eukprot:m.45066 g.45066  ORF g.45066 m.45066 type:complete len:96 (-) comp7201_c0_seq2:129-416(-)
MYIYIFHNCANTYCLLVSFAHFFKVSSFGAMNTHAPIVRIEYTSPPHYLKIAREFGIMDDIKDNIPRTAYFGVVSFYKNGVKIHLAPQRPWKGYE